MAAWHRDTGLPVQRAKFRIAAKASNQNLERKAQSRARFITICHCPCLQSQDAPTASQRLRCFGEALMWTTYEGLCFFSCIETSQRSMNRGGRSSVLPTKQSPGHSHGLRAERASCQFVSYRHLTAAGTSVQRWIQNNGLLITCMPVGIIGGCIRLAHFKVSSSQRLSVCITLILCCVILLPSPIRCSSQLLTISMSYTVAARSAKRPSIFCHHAAVKRSFRSVGDTYVSKR